MTWGVCLEGEKRQRDAVFRGSIDKPAGECAKPRKRVSSRQKRSEDKASHSSSPRGDFQISVKMHGGKNKITPRRTE